MSRLELVILSPQELHQLIVDAVRVVATSDSPRADPWVDAKTAPIQRRRFNELCRKGAFPAIRDGKIYRARLSDVEKYMLSKPARVGLSEPMQALDDPIARELEKGRLRIAKRDSER